MCVHVILLLTCTQDLVLKNKLIHGNNEGFGDERELRMLQVDVGGVFVGTNLRQH